MREKRKKKNVKFFTDAGFMATLDFITNHFTFRGRKEGIYIRDDSVKARHLRSLSYQIM